MLTAQSSVIDKKKKKQQMQANSGTELGSTLSQTSEPGSGIGYLHYPIAQKFTTSAQAWVTSLTNYVWSYGPNVRLDSPTIWRHDPYTGLPGTPMRGATFDYPEAVGGGGTDTAPTTFTAVEPIELDSGTSYWVVYPHALGGHDYAPRGYNAYLAVVGKDKLEGDQVIVLGEVVSTNNGEWTRADPSTTLRMSIRGHTHPHY